jgi:arylsulfatase A-like enzyme
MVLPHDPFFGTPVAGQPGQRTEPGFNNLLSRAEYYVEELIRTLKQEGLYEHTVVVFTADNATLANGKGSCSELGVRVPLIVCGGPVKARGVTDVMVDFTDIYPTLLEIAGVDVTAVDQLDGYSFQALLEGEDYKGKGYVFSFLDLERTVRTREYMMDGSGGIWKCDPSGNLLDYEPMEDSEASASVRRDMMKLIAPYKLPEEKDFGKERMERARRDVPWPSLLAAFRNGDQWMFNERRFGE